MFILRVQKSKEAAVLRILVLSVIGLTVSLAAIAPALAVVTQP